MSPVYLSMNGFFQAGGWGAEQCGWEGMGFRKPPEFRTCHSHMY